MSSIIQRQDHLLLMLPAYMVAYVMSAFSSLVNQLEDSTVLIVVTHTSSAEQIKNCLEKAKLTERYHLIIADNDVPLKMWIQDHLLVGHDSSNANYNYQLLIAKQADQDFHDVMVRVASTLQLPLHILDNTTEMPDGGNILSDGQHLLIGGDEHFKNIPVSVLNGISDKNIYQIKSRLSVAAEQKTACKLAGQEWKAIIHTGNKHNTLQPVFHIDLFLSMAGRKLVDNDKHQSRILVGDPGLAAQALGIQYPELAMQAHFDDIATQLEEAGFLIIRNPLPLVYHDNMEKRERTWYFASSNNVIVKNHGNKRIVWLPTYGHGNWPELAVTDSINAKIWNDLGYQVRLIDDCQPLAENMGGLHCFSKTWG